ncbi:MAG: ACP S-malonyltransferase [Peptococcaceae bacterium]|nr:ACP S-malonyltransferase [Peptococcaceae bacterium]
MKLAFFYAGQGSQYAGMGKDLYEKYPTFRRAYDTADTAFDLKALCLEGPAEVLNRTRYTQPCLVAFAAGISALLAEAGILPDMAAGLSLGEYSALYAAGVFSFSAVISLAVFRGLAMEEAAKGLDSAMTAVLGLPREELEKACAEAAKAAGGLAAIVNYNCPGQLVISGEKAAVEKAAELAEAAGAKKVISLKVSGPFHTALMKPAGAALAEEFRKVSFNSPRFPVVFNATARPLEKGETIQELLVRQVQSPVYLEDSIRYMAAAGVDTAVEIGPGRVISGFIRKTVREMKVCCIEDCPSLEQTIAELKARTSRPEGKPE